MIHDDDDDDDDDDDLEVPRKWKYKGIDLPRELCFYTCLDSLNSGNVSGKCQMSPEITGHQGTFDIVQGTNDIAQGHLRLTR